MLSALALFFCAALVLMLLRIERQQNLTASIALWIPTLWMLIYGSRPVSAWLGYRASGSQVDEMTAGNPYDRIIYSALILLALYVLNKRKIKWFSILKDNPGLVFLLIFSALSILWSHFPLLSMKRWIRFAGFIPAAAVILSEINPLQALISILRRCTYVLMPFSIVLIRYSPLGRHYGRWSGIIAWRGVTLNKNSLGQLCAVSIFFLVWEVLREWRTKCYSRIRSVKIADAFMLGLAIFLLLSGGKQSLSITAISALMISLVSMVFLFRLKNRVQRTASVLILAISFLWVGLMFGGSFLRNATQFVGRDSSFTGRADFWPLLLKEGARHPLLGAGFGGYFGSPGTEFLEETGYFEGHNGLLEVYVELGIAGVILLIAFYLGLYRRFRKELNHAFDWGIFGTSFLVFSWLLNFGESLLLGSESYVWGITVLLSLVFSLRYLNSRQNEIST